MSRFAAGAALPYIGVIDLTIITTVICAILIIGMIWLGSVASVVVLGVSYGLFSGISGCCTSLRRRQGCLALDRYTRYRHDGAHVWADV